MLKPILLKSAFRSLSIICFSLIVLKSPCTAQDTSWIDLFDGKTLNGWTQRGGKAKYEAADGMIVGTTVPNTPNSFLCTDKYYGDFELELEFKVHPELNSGIQIRSNSIKSHNNGRVHGYQVEIDPSDRAWSGGIYDEGRRGWINDLSQNNRARYAFKQNDWNHYRVLAVGDHIQTWINGVPAADLVDKMTDRGFIALQVHGVGGRKDPISVQWRNIRIREKPPVDDTADTIRELIPQATAMDAQKFMELGRSETSPDIDSFEEKQLTVLLAFDSDQTSSQAKAEFEYVDGAASPVELAKEISREGIATMIHDDRIQGFTCRVDGEIATGDFHFEVPKLYRGRAKYIANKVNGDWQITEISMPSRGLFSKRNADGKWQSVDRKPVFPEDAKIEKLAEGFRFTEGPAVGPDGRIYFNDVPNSITHVYDPASGKTSKFREETGRANGMFWTANDALMSCEGANRQVTRREGDQEKVYPATYQDKKLNSPNDITLDTVGGFYFTDPRYQNRDTMELEVEGVFYVNRGGKISLVADDLVRPNGLILSPDFKTLYVADAAAGKIWSYDIVKPGELDSKQLFADVGSDGMSVDTDGNIYLTWRGSIIVYSGGGEKIAELKMPEAPANCVLVGSTLYVTARTGFYKVETNQTGLVE